MNTNAANRIAMRAMNLFALCAGCVLALCVARAHAADVPALRGHVNDYAKLLSADRAAALDARLSDYEQRTQHQFALLTVTSLGGEDIEGFSIRVAEQWKLGHKGKDDGLVVVVSKNDRKMRIEVGYGLEGVVPDAIAARIVRDVMAPAFRDGDYAGGIDGAFAALITTVGGGGADAAAPPRARKPSKSVFGPILFPLLIFLLLSMLSGGRRRRGGIGNAGAFLLGSALGGGGRGGGWGGGGGGGGGGWGGGGGGGFGGGGASGGW